MNTNCQNCGEHNHWESIERIDTPGMRESEWECSNCGATGNVIHHEKAGVVSRSGEYWEK